jgi:hydrogenase maturation protease
MIKTLIVGLGNPILGDDGIGWRVAEDFQRAIAQQRPANEQIEVDFLSVGGLRLMERLIGYDRAIIIDAITTGEYPQGTVRRFSLEELPNRAVGHMSSAHDTTLQNALEAGKTFGAQLPKRIDIVAVESERVYDFSEELTPTAMQAIPQAVQLVQEILNHSQEEQPI